MDKSKWIAGFFVFILLCVFASGCANKPPVVNTPAAANVSNGTAKHIHVHFSDEAQGGVDLSSEPVWYSIDNNGMNMSLAGTVQSTGHSDPAVKNEYLVRIYLRNNGNQSVTYDRLSGIFNYGDKNAKNAVWRDIDEDRPLEPAGIIVYNFYTGAETAKLISESESGRISFRVMLYQDVGDSSKIILAKSTVLPRLEAKNGKASELIPDQEVSLDFGNNNTAITEALSE